MYEYVVEEINKIEEEYDKNFRKVKILFFEYLSSDISPDIFDDKLDEVWYIDYDYITKIINDLKEEDYTEVLETPSISRFKEVETKFKKTIKKYYREKYNQSVDLTTLIENFDKIANTIPYFYKNGTVRCYQTIATYCSMLFTVKIMRTLFNRTLSSKKEFLYLSSHFGSCPKCYPYQGRIYSTDGTTGIVNGKIYYPYQIALDGGVGHPNCKHIWTAYVSQEEKVISWEKNLQEYITLQKEASTKRQIYNLQTDLQAYKIINNQAKVDEITQKIKSLKEKL